MRQRGFILPAGPLVYIIAGLLLVVALTGLYLKVRHDGYAAGAADKQAEWDKDKERARLLEQARVHDVSDAIKEREAQRQAAAQAAADTDSKWKEKLREARRVQAPLASVDAPATGANGSAPAGGAGVPPRVRLTWRFVGLHDGAFTGTDGQPVFRAQSEFALAPERADTASPYGPDDLIDVDGENAIALSSCLRAYDDTVAKVKAAEEAWNKAKR